MFNDEEVLYEVLTVVANISKLVLVKLVTARGDVTVRLVIIIAHEGGVAANHDVHYHTNGPHV